MTHFITILVTCICLVPIHAFCCNTACADNTPLSVFQWDNLPPLPDKLGIGGPFTGTSNDAMIVAGGANFDEAEWGTGIKEWRDEVYVLPKDSEAWIQAEQLPFRRAYGVSVTTPHGIVIAGGSDATRAYTDVRLMRWTNETVEYLTLPDLPKPRAAASGGLIGSTVYIACGQTESAETEVTSTLWSLTLPDSPPDSNEWNELAWESGPSFPGKPRAQAASAVQNGSLHIMSGFTLVDGPDGPERSLLNDAWTFTPGDGWKQIADLPRAAVAAPSIGYGDAHIFVFGGHDGEKSDLVEILKADWPGFNRSVLAYHTITDTWTIMGEMPRAVVTTNAVTFKGNIVIPSGEIKPRIRTNDVMRAEVTGKKASFGILNTLLLGLYLAALVGMGFYFSKREKTTADFFIGGCRIPWWAAGLSIFGTQLSSISFMAIPAKVFATDWTYFTGFVCIVLVQPIVVFFYLPFFRRLNITSAYDYLERRFSTPVRLLGSLSFILFQTGRMTIVLFLPALALSAVTGINIFVCIVLMGVLATLYTVLGGIEAVIWTDVLQVIVLVGGALLSLVIIMFSVDGGVGKIVSTGLADGKFRLAHLTWDYTAPALWVIFIGGLFQNMVSYSADQAVIQRYLTTKDEASAARAIWTNAVMILPIACIWFSLGTALYVFYKANPGLLDPALITDQTFPLFIAQELPDGIVGIVIAGLFAASMSTVDSSLNSTATVIVTDFYKRFRPDATDTSSLSLARIITVVLGTAATLIAIWMAMSDDIMSLWDIYLTVLGLIMGSLTGLFMLGIFTRTTHATGALIGAFGGAGILFYVQRHTGVHFYLYAAVGIMACFVIGLLASVLLPGGKKDTGGLTVHALFRR